MTGPAHGLSMSFLLKKRKKKRSEEMSVAQRSHPAIQNIKNGLKNILRIALASLLLYLLMTQAAYAAQYCFDFGHNSGKVDHICGDFVLFDPIDNTVNTESEGWKLTILGLVHNTFLIPATIEICWAAMMWAFEKDNISPLM